MYYRWLALGILLVTFGAKVVALGHAPRVLQEPDLVFPVSGHTMLVVGLALEAVVIGFLGRTRDPVAAALVVLSFLVPATIYRLMGAWFGTGHCPCLGSLTAWWPWLERNESPVLNTIAAWLILGGVVQIVRRGRWAGRAAPRP